MPRSPLTFGFRATLQRSAPSKCGASHTAVQVGARRFVADGDVQQEQPAHRRFVNIWRQSFEARLPMNDLHLNALQYKVGATSPTSAAPFQVPDTAPTSAADWARLARHLADADQQIVLGGTTFTKVDCLMQALTLEPSDATSWLHLGAALSGGQEVCVNGQAMNTVGCYVRAVECDRWCEVAWSALGMATSSHVTVRGRSMSDADCFVEALNLDPHNAHAWYNLGSTLPSGGTALVQGETVTEADCFHISVQLDPTRGMSWYSLGVVLGENQELRLKSGKVVTRKACYIAALACDDGLFGAWYNLGVELRKQQQPVAVLANKQIVTALQCCVRAVERNPSCGRGWGMLSRMLAPTQYVVISGEQYTQERCEERANALRPREKQQTAGDDAQSPQAPSSSSAGPGTGAGSPAAEKQSN